MTLRIKENKLPDFICRVRDSSCGPEGLIWSTVISELTFRHNYTWRSGFQGVGRLCQLGMCLSTMAASRDMQDVTET